jgi:membrane fusion protein (multidrug efflux system)
MSKLLVTILLLSFSHTAWAKKPPSKPTEVFVAKVEQKQIADEVEALGTLRANETVILSSTVTERITKVNFEDGERVKQGSILVEMEAAEERAELREAESNLREAQQQLDRTKALEKKRVATESLLDERKRNYLNAQARLTAIESRVAERQIAAPFDGIVGLRNISVGALVQPGTTITTIDDDSVMKLDFSVPAVFLSTLKPGVKVEARTRAFEGRVFEGEISSLDSRIDPVTRSILVRAIIDNPLQLLKPGLLMRVTLSKNLRDALVIPEEAIQINGSIHSVFVAVEKDNKLIAEKRSVILGLRRIGEAEITNGLQIGEKIVTHGIIKLRPNSEVIIAATQSGNEALSELLNTKPEKN